MADQEQSDWIEWSGGVCPVAIRNRVQAAFRAGGTRTRMAENFCWLHRRRIDELPYAYDIIAYRLASTDRELAAHLEPTQ